MLPNILTKRGSEIVRESARGLMDAPTANRMLVVCGEAFGFLLAIAVSFLLRFDFAIPQAYLLHFKFACLVIPLAKLFTFKQVGLNRGSWRYFSLHDLKRLVLGNMAASLLCSALILRFGPSGFPRSIYFLDFLLALLVSGGQRAVVRIFVELGRSASGTAEKRALIYGAGSAGYILLREIRQNPGLKYEIIGFVDDDPRKMGHGLAGIQVLGAGSSLPWLAR